MCIRDRPCKQRVVWLYCTHITVVRLARFRFLFDLVEMKFQAEPIDNAARLLPWCALDVAVLPNRVQAVFVWYPGIVCGDARDVYKRQVLYMLKMEHQELHIIGLLHNFQLCVRQRAINLAGANSL